MRIYLLLATLAVVPHDYCQGQQPLRVLGPVSVAHHSQHFFLDLLRLILTKEEASLKAYRLEEVNEAGQKISREQWLLSRGYVDLMWSGTSQELEEILLPVRIPVLGGLLGYRVSIINRKDYQAFSDLSEARWKSLKVCQAEHWPDSDIFAANHYNLVRATSIDAIIKMLDAGRCDYFPRAIHEAWFELATYQQDFPDLTILDNTMFHYPFPSYIFVHKNNQTLAEFLRQHFLLAIEDGSYLTLVQTHSLTRHLFPMERWRTQKKIYLDNPGLPSATPLKDNRLWLKPGG